MHILIDDQELFAQRHGALKLYNVPISERSLIWSHKKFSSGKAIVHNYDDAGAKAILDGLIEDYGPPTATNDALHLSKWKWPDDKVFINYYLDPTPKRTPGSHGSPETTLTIWYGKID